MDKIKFKTPQFINVGLQSGGYPTERTVVPHTTFLVSDTPVDVGKIIPISYQVVNSDVWKPACFLPNPFNDKIYTLLVRYHDGVLASDVFSGNPENGELGLNTGYRYYGTGILKNNIELGDSTFTCNIHDKVKDSNIQAYQVDDYIIISQIVNDVVVKRLMTKIKTVSYNLNEVTIETDSPIQLGFDATLGIDAAGRYTDMCAVSSAFLFDAETDNLNYVTPYVTSVAGNASKLDFDAIQPSFDTIDEVWTLQFRAGNLFNCTGSRVSNLPVGSLSSNYTPTNPANGQPYFTIPSSAWNGQLPVGEEFIFRIKPIYATMFVINGVYNDIINEDIVGDSRKIAVYYHSTV